MLLWISKATRKLSGTQRRLLVVPAVHGPGTSHYHRLHPS